MTNDKEKALKVTLLTHTPEARRTAFTAIRTCYSPNPPSDLFFGDEFDLYEDAPATDGGDGSEADRLFRHIVGSKHTSTLEHINFTFGLEGASRALLAQLTRHRVGVAFSVQSQRYVNDKSGGKKGGFGYVVPPKVAESIHATRVFTDTMAVIQEVYDVLVALGIPAEDARFILPNAAATNITVTFNLRELLHFYRVRSSKHAQWEIRNLAEALRVEVVNAEPWLDPFFQLAKVDDTKKVKVLRDCLKALKNEIEIFHPYEDAFGLLFTIDEALEKTA